MKLNLYLKACLFSQIVAANMKDVIPSFIQPALNYTLKHDQLFRYQSLVFLVFVVNFIPMVLGDAISKIIVVLYRILLEPIVTALMDLMKNSPLFNDTTTVWRKKRKLQHQREILRKQQLAFREESFDDFFNFAEEDASTIKEESLGQESGPTVAKRQPTGAGSSSESFVPPRRSYKSFKEDLKSLKGTKQDIEKLKLLGYNKYRYVSKDFIVRNKLKKENASED
jgi:hypothetical protein